jgi:hypothetical protein
VSLTNVGSVAEFIWTVWTDADRLPASWGEHPHIRLCHKAVAVCTDRHIDYLTGCPKTSFGTSLACKYHQQVWYLSARYTLLSVGRSAFFLKSTQNIPSSRNNTRPVSGEPLRTPGDSQCRTVSLIAAGLLGSTRLEFNLTRHAHLIGVDDYGGQCLSLRLRSSQTLSRCRAQQALSSVDAASAGCIQPLLASAWARPVAADELAPALTGER